VAFGRLERNPGAQPMSDINMTPLIDVMLVLLVIFMITAPLVTPGVIDLPSVGSRLATPVAPLRVELGSDLSLSLREGAAAPIRMSRGELVARVRERQAQNPDQAVVIAADRSVRYEEVIGVLEALQRGGVHKVGLLLRQRQN
jgi:biopolymer transport protein TolR